MKVLKYSYNTSVDNDTVLDPNLIQNTLADELFLRTKYWYEYNYSINGYHEFGKYLYNNNLTELILYNCEVHIALMY